MLALSSQEKSISSLSEEQLVVEALTNLTRELDEAMSENTSRKLKRNYSLNKLNQQEIEELILSEHENEIDAVYNNSGERTTKRSRQITPSLEDYIPQDWDAQLEEICSINSSGYGVSSLENEILSTKSAREYDSMRASKVIYDNTEEELLRSIESDFGGEVVAECLSPKTIRNPLEIETDEPANGLTKDFSPSWVPSVEDLPPPYSP